MRNFQRVFSSNVPAGQVDIKRPAVDIKRPAVDITLGILVRGGTIMRIEQRDILYVVVAMVSLYYI